MWIMKRLWIKIIIVMEMWWIDIKFIGRREAKAAFYEIEMRETQRLLNQEAKKLKRLGYQYVSKRRRGRKGL